MITEDELAGALRTIADRAEDRDVLTGVRAKRRARRRRRAAGTLAAACVVGCAAVLGWGGGGPVPRPADAPRQPRDAVERVWPQAVFTLPVGSRPLEAITATKVLVWTEPGTLEIHDTAARRSMPVASLARPPRLWAADAERVAWLTGDGHAWVAPVRTGGRAGRVGPVRGEHVDRLALTARHVVWSSPLDGVWRAGLDGGAPERVPGGRGLQLVEWPWATDEPLDARTNPTKVVNLETRRVIEVRPVPGAEGLRCGPTWCTGTHRGGDALVQRTDGAWSRTHRDWLTGYPYRDRFITGAGRIHDARTGTTVSFGAGRWSQGGGVVSWPVDGGVRALNLAAVPPG
ncbi:hypothetical protein ACBI99_36430 [Nonomuraea sp. ATR24]|uniref:hypothetical protein n=1 Tax=Nonomuraea sp. ATR24 TaxID=1676744 RepID=UPI0035C0252D